jgi:FdrA protein
METVCKILASTYRDSVLLMRIARIIRERQGILGAEVMMATESNKAILLEENFHLTDAVMAARPSDLIICVAAENKEKADEAISHAEELTARGIVTLKTTQIAPSQDSALAILPRANLTLISIPGPYVKKEAIKALDKGLNVMIFSDNVPLHDEIEIKRYGVDKGKLVMGPDCGTAIINGVALGFANRVRRGSVGLVGASGTGLQEMSVLVHRQGAGVSQALGTGGRDVLDDVGGLSMIECIRILEDDHNTEVIVVVSKPPGERTLETIRKHLQLCSKPAVVNFLGKYAKAFAEGNIQFTLTLEETATTAVKKVGKHQAFSWKRDAAPSVIEPQQYKMTDHQRYIRGLFAGGTLAVEACVILRNIVSLLWSNFRLSGVKQLEDSRASRGHCVVDLGADEFTVGKPHPMLEPSMRREWILSEARDPEVAVILLDFVLGWGVHRDPIGASVSYIHEAQRVAERAGRHLQIVCSVCGTDEDPQNRSAGVKLLQRYGVIVAATNAEAARISAAIALRQRWERHDG